MRTFIAIKLNRDTQKKLSIALKPFKKINSPVRWIKPESIHLTLKFLGEISEDRVIEIIDLLSTVKKSHKEDLILNFNGFGYFGRGDLLKILWIKITDNHILASLYEGIENRLEKIGFPKDDRNFLPHLTIGRNKTKFELKRYNQILRESEDQMITTQRVNSFHMMKSELSPTGAKYTSLKEIHIE